MATKPPAVPALPSGARQQETGQQIKDLRAPSAHPPSVSAEDERIRFAVETLRHLGYTAGAVGVCAAFRAAESAAYARGRKELEGALRAATDPNSDPWLHLREKSEAILMSVSEERWTDLEMQVREWLVLLMGAPAMLRALLGSVATAPTAPPSASGALAGAEELTTQETNQQRAEETPAPPSEKE